MNLVYLFLIISSKFDDHFFFFNSLSSSTSSTGRVIRAVSLCLFNPIQVGQLYWSETSGLARYSIPAHASPSKVHLRPTSYLNSNHEHVNHLTSRLPQITDELSTERYLDQVYDGLVTLDESRLKELIETDLVSSTNI